MKRLKKNCCLSNFYFFLLNYLPQVDRGSEEPDDGSSDRRGSESTPSPGKPGSESPKGRGRSSQDLDAASTNGTNGSNGTNGGNGQTNGIGANGMNGGLWLCLAV